MKWRALCRIFLMIVLCTNVTRGQDLPAFLLDDPVEGEILADEIKPSWQLQLIQSECFTPGQREEIHKYFEAMPFVSWYQLQSISNIPVEQIRCALQFSKEKAALKIRGEKDEKIRLSLQYKPTSNSSEFLFRLKLPLGTNWKAGLLIEKDKGESWWYKNGPDFSSFHFTGNYHRGPIKRIIIGDYRVRFGQGLLCNTFFRQGAFLRNGIAPVFSESSIKPFQSLDENQAFRGVSMMAQTQSWKLISFISYRYLDASINAIENRINSLSKSGRHVTETEVSAKDAVKNWVGGLHLGYKNQKGKIGISMIASHLDKSWSKTKRIDQYLRTDSKTRVGISLDYQYTSKRFSWFGEIAIQNQGSTSTIHTLLWSPSSTHNLSLSWQYIHPAFDARFTQSFFRRSFQPNEKGWIFGYTFTPSRNFELSVNHRSFIHPSWTYLQKPFRRGHEFALSASFRKRKNYEVNLSVRNQIRDRTLDRNLESQKDNQVRLHYSKVIASGIELRSRIEWRLSHFGKRLPDAWLLYQELFYKPMESPIRLTLRCTYYTTSSFENRIYAYTHELGGGFSIPAYHGNGIEQYCLVSYKLKSAQVQAHMRIARKSRLLTVFYGLRFQIAL